MNNFCFLPCVSIRVSYVGLCSVESILCNVQFRNFSMHVLYVYSYMYMWYDMACDMVCDMMIYSDVPPVRSSAFVCGYVFGVILVSIL